MIDDISHGPSADPFPVSRWIIAGTIVVASLVWLLQPHVMEELEAPRRTQCKNNLKQIGLALYNYEETYQSFPPTAGGEPPASWRVRLLPYCDQAKLHEQYDFAAAWDAESNGEIPRRDVPGYRCPSARQQHDRDGRYFTSYVAPAGPRTVLRPDRSCDFAEITDGLSNSIAVVELTDSDIVWSEPRDVSANWRPTGEKPGSPTAKLATPTHQQKGGHVLFADGAVRYLGRDIDARIVEKLLTVDGGEDMTGWE